MYSNPSYKAGSQTCGDTDNRKINGLMAVGFQESRPAKPRTTKQKTIPETKRNREMNCPLKLTDREEDT